MQQKQCHNARIRVKKALSAKKRRFLPLQAVRTLFLCVILRQITLNIIYMYTVDELNDRLIDLAFSED
ncbi:MAG: hypothetical protein SO001_02845, partial [Alloprevotella sp.]|nr:hypothetical protein [Alloprevotella sp.]